ncbi:Tricorn protease [Trema orientale]|uniref:Tricorn protease n=1 Tax=Trema orientale TaxID=63057 RepID=A0A2P5E8U2_TREOI|nr:Tricorn protease [Trema orientale]
MAEKRGSIAFFATYRPPVPLDIFSCPFTPTSKQDELHLTDGKSYNYNAQIIPPAALKIILKRPKLASEGNEADVDSGRLSGMVFVSERGGLETLYIALRFNDNSPKVKVFNFADVFGTFNGVRMEDSGRIAGTRLVFRSTRDGGDKKHKNLYIIENAQSRDVGEASITRLTNGPWTDTHCQWSPRGDWIVFSSTRDKPSGAPETDNNLDPGYFAVFIVNANDPSVVVRVIGSANDLAGHVNHPFFSPDGKSIVVTADLAAVSVDPISLPLFVHSVRPYGDIFTVDIDPDDINKNKNLKNFTRITHSKYEYSTASWTMYSTHDQNAAWNLLLDKSIDYTPSCPYAYTDGGESWHMTGHLLIPKRRC